MFNQLLGDFKKRQEDMQVYLSNMRVKHTYKEGLIQIIMDGNKNVIDLKLDSKKIDDFEELEDHLIIAMNEVVNKVQVETEVKSKDFLDNIMPDGLNQLLSS